jgi:hypothetical protein
MRLSNSKPRSISTDPLSTLLCVHGRPIELVVYQCSYSLKGMGELISRWGPLNALLRLHGRPIKLVVYQCSYSLQGMGELI